MKLRPVHPGQTLKGELGHWKYSANDFAKKVGVPANRITDIIRGRRGITADTALILADALGGRAEYWMALQSNYELALAREKREKEKANSPFNYTEECPYP